MLNGWYPGFRLDMDEVARAKKLTTFGSHGPIYHIANRREAGGRHGLVLDGESVPVMTRLCAWTCTCEVESWFGRPICLA